MTQTNERIFSAVTWVHAKGLIRVITDMDAAIAAVQAGQPVDDRYVGTWQGAFKQERLGL